LFRSADSCVCHASSEAVCVVEFLAAWGEGNDPNAPVFGPLDAADQALPDEAVDSVY
jgi:hypothetical protein